MVHPVPRARVSHARRAADARLAEAVSLAEAISLEIPAAAAVPLAAAKPAPLFGRGPVHPLQAHHTFLTEGGEAIPLHRA